MSSHPIPNFQELDKYNSLSTKKERKTLFSNFGPPPKAPVRSCPVPRIYSLIKENAPRPISFREDSDISFITGSPIYRSRKGTYFEQCYRIVNILGKGSFGEVFKVVSKENDLQYACKKNILQYRGIEDRTRRIQEVKKHEQMAPHVNIIKFYRAWEENNHLYLLTEVCSHTLADILVDNHEFPEHQLWTFLVDILQGLDHLHKHTFIHMDVKPDNIFIGMDERCKLGDFGLSIDFTNGYPKEAVDGDPKYLAPECLQLVYTPAADVFSLGIVMLEMATDLYLPHAGPKWHDLRNGNIPGMDNRGLSVEFESVIRMLLEPDHTRRITSSQALEYKPVRKVVVRNNFNHFFKSKIRAVTNWLGSILFLPLMFFSYFTSIFKRRIIGYNSPKTVMRTCTPDASSENIDMDIDADKLETKYMNSLSKDLRKIRALEPLVNSTPKSHSKRIIFPKQNWERSKRDEEEIDGSKYSFNESSFSSLELSRELTVPSMSDSRMESPSMTNSHLSACNMTARNLLEVFNTAESSEDES